MDERTTTLIERNYGKAYKLSAVVRYGLNPPNWDLSLPDGVCTSMDIPESGNPNASASVGYIDPFNRYIVDYSAVRLQKESATVKTEKRRYVIRVFIWFNDFGGKAPFSAFGSFDDNGFLVDMLPCMGSTGVNENFQHYLGNFGWNSNLILGSKFYTYGEIFSGGRIGFMFDIKVPSSGILHYFAFITPKD
jgi:hypothetical protein